MAPIISGRRPSFVDHPISPAAADRVLGVCPEAADLLRDKPVSIDALCALRVLVPALQVEVARSMIAVNLYSAAHARAIAAITLDAGLNNVANRHGRAVGAAKLARMQRSWASLQGRFDAAQARYREDAIALVLLRGYLDRLLGNARVVRYLAHHHSDALRLFQDLIEAAPQDPAPKRGHRRPAGSA